MSQTKRILVTLSTGKQGSGVVRALAQRNIKQRQYEILAVTRSASSSKAKALTQLPGVFAVESEYDINRIFEKASTVGRGGPIHGIFSVQLFDGKDGVAGEERLGKEVIDVAARNKVQHLVYTSVDRGYLDQTNIPHFESKRHIEEYLNELHSQMNWTILRPVAFMDNISTGTTFMGKVGNTMFTNALKKPVQLIACSDIGEFAAQAFDQPEVYMGQAVSLAGDERSPDQMKESYKKLRGVDLPVTFSILGSAILLISKEMNTMFHFFNTEGYKADIGALKKKHPGLKTWEEYIKTEM